MENKLFAHISALAYVPFSGEKGFWMSIHPVVNQQFMKFVEQTNYQTSVESGLSIAVGINGEYDNSLSWKILKNKELFPTIFVTFTDAQAYTKWANQRLPTVEEWQIAARGRLKVQVEGDFIDPLYPWGNNEPDRNDCFFSPNEKHSIQVHGVFDYNPNGLGIYSLVGNVWQYCLPLAEEDGLCRRQGGAWNVRESFRLKINNNGVCKTSSATSNQGFRTVQDSLGGDFEAFWRSLLSNMTPDGGGANLIFFPNNGLLNILLTGTCIICPSKENSAEAIVSRIIGQKYPFIRDVHVYSQETRII